MHTYFATTPDVAQENSPIHFLTTKNAGAKAPVFMPRLGRWGEWVGYLKGESEVGADREPGSAVIPAKFAGDLARRSATTEINVTVVRIDGVEIDAVTDRIESNGWTAVVVNTYDHGRTETLLPRDDVLRWLGKNATADNGGKEINAASITHYAGEILGWLDTAETIELVDASRQTPEGAMVVIRHDPLVSVLVSSPLDPPYRPADSKTHAGGVSRWGDVLETVEHAISGRSAMSKAARNPAAVIPVPRVRPTAEPIYREINGSPLDWSLLGVEEPAVVTAPTFAAEPTAMDSRVAALTSKSADADVQAAIAAAIAGANGPLDEARRLQEIREKIDAPARAFNAAVKGSRLSKSDDDQENGSPLSAKAEAVLSAAYPPLPRVGNKLYAYRGYASRPWLYSGSQGGGATRLWTPWAIEGGVVEIDDGSRAGIRVSALSADGAQTNFVVTAADFFNQGGLLFKVALRNAGVGMTEAGEFEAVRQVREVVPSNPTRIYKRPGFRDGAFVTGWGRVVGSNRPVEIAPGSRPAGPEVAGDLEGWKKAAKVALESSVLHFGVGVLAGFASPIIDLCGLPTSFVAYSGESGQGKTTAQELQVSAWGCTTAKKGLLGTFDTTPKANANLMERASGMGLAMDEYKLTDGVILQHFIFSGATGAGRDRLNRNSELMGVSSWSLLVTLSGEVSLADKIGGAGDEVAGGLSARAIDLDVGGEPQLPAETLARICGVRDNFGYAGPAFVQALFTQGHVADPVSLKNKVEAKALALVGNDASSTHLRAARIVGVLWMAGEVAAKASLIPDNFDLEALARRIWCRAQEAETAAGSTNDRAVETLYRHLFAGRGGDVHEDHLGDHRAAKAWRIDPGNAATGKLTAAACGGAVYVVPVANIVSLSGHALGHKAVVRALADAGALVLQRRGAREERVWDFVPGLSRMRAIIIKASAIEDAPASIIENEQ